MDIRRHFRYSTSSDLTAAHIGINRWDWDSIDEENEEKAKKIMAKKRFDVLPIEESDGSYKRFYVTRNWNDYDYLNVDSVNKTNSVYYRLAFEDLVRKFKEEERHFYFLTNEKEVFGLVSLVNLNSQAVYNYLFQVISDIEKSVSELLKDELNQGQILDKFDSLDDQHIKNVSKKFRQAMAEGKDNTLFEYMHLQTIGITINKFVQELPEESKRLNKYSSKFCPQGTYLEIRNKIMHPVRPILNDTDSISDIHELLSDYMEIKQILINSN